MAIVRFASSSLGGKTTSEIKKSPKVRVPMGTHFGTHSPRLVRAHTNRDIKEQDQIKIRKSFEKAALEGAIRRPVIHVEFKSPRSIEECVSCQSTHFLYVYVGLCNVFLLQFIMVVLLFFAEKEVNLSELGAYYN